MTETVYVQRRAGAIVGVYANPQPGYAEEAMPDSDPAVVAFRTPPQVAKPRDPLAELDAFKGVLANAKSIADINAAAVAVAAVADLAQP